MVYFDFKKFLHVKLTFSGRITQKEGWQQKLPSHNLHLYYCFIEQFTISNTCTPLDLEQIELKTNKKMLQIAE